MIVISEFLANIRVSIRGSKSIIDHRSNSFIEEVVTIDETIVHFGFHFFITNVQEH